MARSRRYTPETVSDANFAEELSFLVNSHSQAEFPVHCLKEAAGTIGDYENVNKTEHLRFK